MNDFVETLKFMVKYTPQAILVLIGAALLWAVLLVGSVLLMAGFDMAQAHLSPSAADDRFHDEAVRAGHAEYYLDQNRVRQWRWLPTDAAVEREVRYDR